jgi:RNA polymerase sigma-70 factor (ECF subfamily)
MDQVPPPGEGRLADERELIARVIRGDETAARALYDAHVDRIYRLAYRMCGRPELAREFTQDAFVRAFDRLAEFRGEASLATWLHAIAVSVVLNGLRRVKRFRDREAGLDEVRQLGVEHRALEPDLKQRLHRAIDRLPEHGRVVFLMHDLEGFTHEEIGETLGIPSGTSKARLSRARAALREELADFAGEWAR